jgi:hypothetical protein
MYCFEIHWTEWSDAHRAQGFIEQDKTDEIDVRERQWIKTAGQLKDLRPNRRRKVEMSGTREISA